MGQTKSEKVQYPNNQAVVYGCFGVVGDKLFNVPICQFMDVPKYQLSDVTICRCSNFLQRRYRFDLGKTKKSGGK